MACEPEKRSRSGACAPGPKSVPNRRRTDGVGHKTLTGRFRHKEWAKRIALMLLEIENDDVLRITIEKIIITIAEQARQRSPDFKGKFKIIK